MSALKQANVRLREQLEVAKIEIVSIKIRVLAVEKITKITISDRDMWRKRCFELGYKESGRPPETL